MNWAAHVRRFNVKQFKLRYRMRAEYFYDLLDGDVTRLLDGELTVHSERQAKNAKSGQLIVPEVRLAAALRCFAGGAVDDLALIYRISKSEVYDSVWAVVDAVNHAHKSELSMDLDDAEKLKTLKLEFRARSKKQVWAGQIGAVDGVHFKMNKPSDKDVPDAGKYYVSRKGMYALLCIATCDVHRRFLDMDISQLPTTHDSLAYLASDLGSAVNAGQHFLNGDAAFQGARWMVWPSGEAEFDDFDFF